MLNFIESGSIIKWKVCTVTLPMPAPDSRVHWACPAAGHLASASLYPACRTPYALVTACDDDVLRSGENLALIFRVD